MNVGKVLNVYKERVARLTMWKAELNYLERTKVKTSTLTDEIMGQRVSMVDKYEKLMERKEELKVMIADEEIKVIAVDTAFNVLAQTHPHYSNMLRMKYLENKTYEYIAEKLGYGVTSIYRNMPKSEKHFAEILNYSSLGKNGSEMIA